MNESIKISKDAIYATGKRKSLLREYGFLR